MNPQSHIIQSIFGHRDFIDNFDAWLNKRDEIANLLSRSFQNAQKKEDFLIHKGDPSGKSIIDAVYFTFDSGADIEESCYNFDEDFRLKVNWSEGIMIAIQKRMFSRQKTYKSNKADWLEGSWKSL